MRSFIWCCLLPLFSAAQNTFDIQGHRGARGLYPENTIPAFIAAIDLGVNTLELDVVVSKDGQLVVSHEPFFNSDICRDAAGNVLQQPKEKHNIYQLNYSEISQYDCGSWGNPRFAEQQSIKAAKPLLSDVIDTVEAYLRKKGLPRVFYNIETKCTPEGDNIYHPEPKIFAEMFYQMLKKKDVLNYCIIQSFDVRTLQVLHQNHSELKLALLVFNADGLKGNLSKLGFTPNIYSPNFVLVNRKLVIACHKQNMQVIPWTINEPDKMKKIKALGVDGLITDYPDRAIKALR